MTLEGGRQLARESAIQGKRIAKAQTWHKARHTMATITKANKAQAQAQAQAQADKLAQFEAALLAAVAAGVLTGDAIDKAIFKAGFAMSEAEHADARPVNKADKAKADLLAFGIDADAIKAESVKAGALAVNLDALAKAVGKYGKYAVIYDADNGTSACTHYMLNALAKAGRVTLADTLAFVRQHKPTYASAGHYNTIKSLLKKAGYRLNVAQGSFSISA